MNKVLKLLLFFVIAILTTNCSSQKYLLHPEEYESDVTAPDSFNVRFETTEGNFFIGINREYSPLAADRFYYLCENNFFENAGFFRVVPGFVVQFGLSAKPELNKIWQERNIVDEPVKYSNKKGTIAFARAGKDTRSIQLYINLGDNERLDSYEGPGVVGFPAFGRVYHGMDVVESINAEYKQDPQQDRIASEGKEYLKQNFPNLDYILKTEIVYESD
ncbi:MAG: peptidylprolyl isomerase [Melioribacteraceae bacterium]|nr:peptidylprolyl isomerase [Melioribacteraceae bacterium]MCF8264618.1 peptidylprolyl isomerase [Melioribacteraceae bacterium]MCF8414465.1 peptidylprolyl isomerase [Melioribacteraceae bacterium]